MDRRTRPLRSEYARSADAYICNSVPHNSGGQSEWRENSAFALAVEREDGSIHYLAAAEKYTKDGMKFFSVAATQKMHHCRLFGNKAKLYRFKALAPLAPRDRKGRMLLDAAFPVPVRAFPSPPKNYDRIGGGNV